MQTHNLSNAFRDTFHSVTPDTYVPGTCSECGRVFDLSDPVDAAEWSFGHDCEV